MKKMYIAIIAGIAVVALSIMLIVFVLPVVKNNATPTKEIPTFVFDPDLYDGNFAQQARDHFSTLSNTTEEEFQNDLAAYDYRETTSIEDMIIWSKFIDGIETNEMYCRFYGTLFKSITSVSQEDVDKLFANPEHDPRNLDETPYLEEYREMEKVSETKIDSIDIGCRILRINGELYPVKQIGIILSRDVEDSDTPLKWGKAFTVNAITKEIIPDEFLVSEKFFPPEMYLIN